MNQTPATRSSNSFIFDAEWNRERIELIKRTFCKGATDDELHLFIATARKLGLSPELKQIHAVKRWDSKERRDVMAIQVSIDGYRIVAERSGQYRGQVGPEWCGPDGQWRDTWMDKAAPSAARVGVIKENFAEPMWAVAHWDEYVQTTKEHNPTMMWSKMPRLMLAKCAESLALRKAFPNELCGTHSEGEEIQGADVGEKLNPGELKRQAEMQQRVEKMVKAFAARGVSEVMVIDMCGKDSLQALTDHDFGTLQKVYAEIVSGKVTLKQLADELYPGDVVDALPAAAPEESLSEELASQPAAEPIT